MPTVVGLTQAEAEKALAARGLHDDVSTAFSESVTRGTVVSADPTDGGRLRKGGTVDLVVSKGPERYAVPRLAGLTEDAARAAITAAHLEVGAVSRQFSSTVPDGSVIKGSLTTGAKVRPGTTVDLVVSRGREPVAVASWVGKPADQAVAALKASGLKVTTTQAFDDEVAQGSVVSQKPGAGTAFKGDTVRLVVSKGPHLVPVPRVVGRQVDQARATLEQLGFQVEVRKILGGYFGSVRSQSPRADSQAPYGSTVVLTVV
ncbi:hypothetical protein GCM10027446_24240 [Angustibacter peucedani]